MAGRFGESVLSEYSGRDTKSPLTRCHVSNYYNLADILKTRKYGVYEPKVFPAAANQLSTETRFIDDRLDNVEQNYDLACNMNVVFILCRFLIVMFLVHRN